VDPASNLLKGFIITSPMLKKLGSIPGNHSSSNLVHQSLGLADLCLCDVSVALAEESLAVDLYVQLIALSYHVSQLMQLLRGDLLTCCSLQWKVAWRWRLGTVRC
jgi:hypothetical protein